jgi:hypothetical protein
LSFRTGERIIITQACAADYHCRPDYVGGQLVHDNWKENSTTNCAVGGRCSIQYINRSAFALVPVDPRTRIAVRPGNVGNGIIRSPLNWSVDVALSKNFRIAERVNLQLRADMFNFLNRVNYGSPNGNMSSANFGEINGAGGMRVVQLNARLTW